MKVAIVSYNAGNVCSVDYALKRLGVEAVVTDSPEVLRTADRVIFPGVGEAKTTMCHLRATGLDRVLVELKQPVLGICLGMQLLCRHSEEGDVDCLGIFDTEVKRFLPNAQQEKVPHVGWNTLHSISGNLFDGLTQEEYVYFVHSYYVPLSQYTSAACDYILPFSAALQKDNFYATQFHPEKSGWVGECILHNFLSIK